MTKSEWSKAPWKVRWSLARVACPDCMGQVTPCDMGQVTPCDNCLATDRTPLPWSELFDLEEMRK